jgi:hypothetical protein
MLPLIARRLTGNLAIALLRLIVLPESRERR